MAKIFYKGFSSQLWESGDRTFQARNKDVVKQDLLNHIFTSKGERVMMPGFGTRIPSLPFEPIDATTLKIVEDDIREVVNFDPRVELLDLNVLPLSDNNAILAYVTVQYLELGGVETFNIEVPAGNS
jgi:uncharacterized protein